MNKGSADAFAGWAANLTVGGLPGPVQTHLRRSVLDHLGVALGGIDEPVTRAALAGARSNAVDPDRLGVAEAAMVQGVAAHALDFDDGYSAGSFHPGAATVASAWAVGARVEASLQELLVAVAAGYEVGCRLAKAIHPHASHAGFHNTAVLGAVSSAVAAATLLGSSPDEARSALTLACASAGGMYRHDRTWAPVDNYQPGRLAREGIHFAFQARAGLAGPGDVLDEGGAFLTTFGQQTAERLTEGLGEDWELLGTHFKPYPACRHSHPAIDAALRLHPVLADDLSSIETITVSTYAQAAHLSAGATDIDSARMSLPFLVASALQVGSLSLGNFEEGALADPLTQSLATRTRVTEDPRASAAYPLRRSAGIEVAFDGQVTTVWIPQSRGEPDCPLTDEELRDKFRWLAAGQLDEAAIRRTEEQVLVGNPTLAGTVVPPLTGPLLT